MIKAIETKYRGYRMRSRLEARWAIFFDALGITWQYEPDKFPVGRGKRYVPDFWLPQVRMFAEVKPYTFEPEALRKCFALANHTGYECLLLDGDPAPQTYWACLPSESGLDMLDYWIDKCWVDKLGRFFFCGNSDYPNHHEIPGDDSAMIAACEKARAERFDPKPIRLPDDLRQAVLYAKQQIRECEPAGLSIWRAADYYGVDQALVAKYVRKYIA